MVARRRHSPSEASHSCFSTEAGAGEMLGRVGLAHNAQATPRMPGNMPLLPGAGPTTQDRQAGSAGAVEECLPQICSIVAGLCGCSCLGELFSGLCSFLCNMIPRNGLGEEPRPGEGRQSREMREKRETVRVEEKRVMVRTQTSTSEEEDCPLLLSSSSTSPATLEGTIKTRNTRRVETETVQCSLSSSSASSYASAALTQPLPLVAWVLKKKKKH